MSDKNRIISFICVLAMLLSASVGLFTANAADEYFFSESFEGASLPSGWKKTSSNVNSGVSKVRASDGNQSLNLKDSYTDRSAGIESPKINPERGKYYKISVDVYNETGNATVFVRFYESASSSTHSDQISSTATVTGRWTTVEFTVSLPENASCVSILLYSGMANKGVMYFDNVRIIEDKESDDTDIIGFTPQNNAHPKLFFNESELVQIKTLAADTVKNNAGFVGSSVYSSLIAEADKLLTQTSFDMTYYGTKKVTYSIPFTEEHITAVPQGYGSSNYPYWQEMGNKIKEMLQTLSLAYSITGNSVYASRAKELALSLCEWSTWTEYPTINRTSLETGYLTVGVASVYDMCYDTLDNSQKTVMANAVKDLGTSKLYADLSSFTDHNYYVNKASALAICSSLFLGEDDDAVKYLSRAYKYMSRYLDERLSSESHEGLSYTSYSLDLIFTALNTVRRVTGREELINHKYTEVALMWAVMSSESQNGTGTPISDTYNDTYFYITFNTMARLQNNGLAGWYLSTRKFDTTDFNRLVYSCPDLVTESPEDYMKRTGVNIQNGVIPYIGWGTLRADDMLLVCVANNSSQGHSHYDQNSFVLAKGGSWLLSDPGYQDYGGGYASDYSLAYGHSTLLIDGKAQDYKGGGKLDMLFDASSCSYLIGEVSGAYATDTVFDRGFIMVNHSGASYYVIADDIVSDSSHTYDWVLNSEAISSFRYFRDDGSLGYLSSGASINTGLFGVSGKTGALAVSFDRKLNVNYSSWNGIGSLITATDGTSSQNGAFCTVISPVDGSITKSSMETVVKITEGLSNGTQNGCITGYGDGYSDIILVSKSTGTTLSGAGLECDGTFATLFGLKNGAYTGYTAVNATKLTYNGRVLLQSDIPVSVTVNFDGSESLVTGTAGNDVTLYAPFGIGDCTPDENGNITLTLAAERTNPEVTVGTIQENPQDITEITDTTDTHDTTSIPPVKNSINFIIVVNVTIVATLLIIVAVVIIIRNARVKKRQ